MRCTQFHKLPPTPLPRPPPPTLAAPPPPTSLPPLASTPSLPNPPSSWVRCRHGSDQARAMVLQLRTPLMVAGSLDMMKLIVAAWPAVDVNWSCFPDGSTTLHCATSVGKAFALATTTVFGGAALAFVINSV